MAAAILILLVLTGLNFISNAQANGGKSSSEREGRFNGSLELSCSYKHPKNDAQEASLAWFRDGTKLMSEQEGYSIENKSGKSTLKIHNLHLNDEKAVFRFSRVDNASVETSLCVFEKIRVLPEITTERSDEKLTAERITIRRGSGESIRLTCRLTADANPALIPKWQFSPENKDFHELPNAIVARDNDLIIDTIGRHHRGYYQCSFADHDGTSTVLLRMNDRFAAWWPFLGIVVVVIVCVLIILAIEKRRKASRKAAAAAVAASDEKTTDPLVRETDRSNVDENKKSYVNA